MFKGVVFWGLTALFHRYETFTVAGMSKGRCRYGRQQGQRRGANASLEFENDGVICCSTVKYSEISLFNLAFASNLLECSLFFLFFVLLPSAKKIADFVLAAFVKCPKFCL